MHEYANLKHAHILVSVLASLLARFEYQSLDLHERFLRDLFKNTTKPVKA